MKMHSGQMVQTKANILVSFLFIFFPAMLVARAMAFRAISFGGAHYVAFRAIHPLCLLLF
ncbi:MAG: hypothetical protein U9Q34_05965 [Elusimicrobiota bacterium]|nr:hypothetical protein [Elusimicrobiota bacterium]